MRKNGLQGLLALGCALLLVGCGGDLPQTEPTVPPEPPTTQTAETTVPTEPTVPPTTEPELPVGASVTINGVTLASPGILFDDTLYAKADEFAAALGVDVTELAVLHYRGDAYLPVEVACEAFRLSFLADHEYPMVYCTAAAYAQEIPQGYDVPVLMYHGVADETWGVTELFVRPSELEQQLAYLVENGYDPIFFSDLKDVDQYDKPVILTFDDGYEDNYTNLFPLLQKYQVKATIFLIADNIGTRENFLTPAQILEMNESGLVSFQSHTLSHPMLDEIDDVWRQFEIRHSRLVLTRLTGLEPYVLCYPSGQNNSAVRADTAEFYSFGVEMNGGMYTTGMDLTRIPRFYVSRSTTIWDYRWMLGE